jgi:putative hydrolase of the HAD superfamily
MATMNHPTIKCLFVDVGGVLLTDGWSHGTSTLAAKRFDLDLEDLKTRHSQALDTYEEGKLTFDEFLDRVVFNEERSFTQAQFRKFILAQSKPHTEMIGLVSRLKTRYALKIVVVSNEGRELNEFRIHKFKLDGFVDCFISSCYVRVRKPDADIFRVALDTMHVRAKEVVYIDNTPMFVQVAERLGIKSILHTDYKSSCAKLVSLGLEVIN